MQKANSCQKRARARVGVRACANRNRFISKCAFIIERVLQIFHFEQSVDHLVKRWAIAWLFGPTSLHLWFATRQTHTHKSARKCKSMKTTHVFHGKKKHKIRNKTYQSWNWFRHIFRDRWSQSTNFFKIYNLANKTKETHTYIYTAKKKRWKNMRKFYLVPTANTTWNGGMPAKGSSRVAH